MNTQIKKIMPALAMLVGTAAPACAQEASGDASAQLTYWDYVLYVLRHTSPAMWVGIAVFIVLVALMIGWLWGRAWNNQWKPWSSTLPSYSICAVLAILTYFTPMYVMGNGELGIFDSTTANITFADLATGIDNRPKQADFIEKVAKERIGENVNLTDNKDYKFEKDYQGYVSFMQMNMWTIVGVIGLLMILVAIMAYSDIRIIAPAVTAQVSEEKE